ncbi:hypothetical protein M1C57_15135 [Rhodococcus pyridinivorans]|uniref:hypothetical protein n=1 Tax=Rhodococcus TaxID=1827 RepID=UPI0007EBDED6|nr:MULTISPECIES: hypothetical protein [Rhodococcus]MCD2142813.1 hypothetical protein [Rhodococcus pyridinivorans]OBA35667.1 hypothetical protein A5767_10780 [Rhodococcus sp. 852002-51564_SCH6189132-a]QXU54037.1 hypothetical protein KXC42_01585 [Rhodococcus sp. LW-XY12]UPW03015.1 hypothetical protein M1C57_15135 [Rhodococcus pyridinivorans]
MDVQLTAAHWVYLAGILVILATMALRKNIVVPAVVATFLTALTFSGSIVTGLSAIFNASLVAAKELFNIFLIIAMVTAMLGALRQLGADRMMVAPFRRVMRAGTSSFLVLAAVTYVISLFFWPTPAVPLVGAVLIPVAIRAGMSPLSVGMVIAICGQGMALSSDYIIKVAPGISASAAGVEADAVADKAMVLSLIVGGTALLITYLVQKRHWRAPSPDLLVEWEAAADRGIGDTADRGIGETRDDSSGDGGGSRPPRRPEPAGGPSGGGEQAATATAVLVAPSDPIADPDSAAEKERRGTAKAFAMLVPLAYLAFIVYLMLGKFTEVVPPLQGGDAAAIVGGIAALILFAAAASTDRGGFLETTSDHLVDGLVFAFKAMGCVLPIAGFFFIGNPEFAGPILGISADAAGPAILFDLVTTVQSHLPQNAFITSFGILLIGLVAGLDGSGFSGLPLTGALSGALGPAVDVDPSTLAAIGQMGNIWAGGGVIIAWSSLVAVAGFARVPVLDLARKCFLPVMAGLILSTVFAVLVF